MNAPLPPSTFCAEGPDSLYRTALKQGRFLIQRCRDCLSHVFYPRLACPVCGAASLDWVQASGAGVVYSTSVVRCAPDAPYNISLIDLAEGPRLLARVTGVAPEAVTIGMPVRAYIDSLDGPPLVLFRPGSQSA